MENFKVSVLVPVYKVEKQLQRCIDSLVSQSYKNIEIILIDDGSPDSCGEICEYYTEKDSRIIVIHKVNNGLSSSRNAALSLCSGEYLLFLDGDDSIDEDMIAKCLKYIQDEKTDVLTFGFYLYEDWLEYTKKITDASKIEKMILSKSELDSEFISLQQEGVLDFCTDKFYRSDIILDNKILFNQLCDGVSEDADFILEIYPYLSSLRVVKDCFYNYYRRPDESFTRSFRINRFDLLHQRLLKEKQIIERYSIPFEKEYFVDKYLTYVLWTYESLFYQSCSLGIWEKLLFLRRAFEKEELYEGFRQDAQKAIAIGYPKGDYAKTTIIALSLIVKKKYILLSILFLLINLRKGKS